MNLFVPDAFHYLQKTGQPSPAAMDMIKLVALLAMLIDHINTLFLTPAWPVMYALGRMAFPVHAYMGDERAAFARTSAGKANRLWIWAVITQPVFSLAFLDHQPWWAMSILFVFAGVTQLLALRYRYGQKGNLVGGLLLALMIFPLQPASYGLSGVILAVSLATVTGSSAPEMKRRAAFVAVLSLLCLNGITHLLSMPAETLLLATLPTLVFP
jgi:cobalamin synthase